MSWESCVVLSAALPTVVLMGYEERLHTHECTLIKYRATRAAL